MTRETLRQRIARAERIAKHTNACKPEVWLDGRRIIEARHDANGRLLGVLVVVPEPGPTLADALADDPVYQVACGIEGIDPDTGLPQY